MQFRLFKIYCKSSDISTIRRFNVLADSAKMAGEAFLRLYPRFIILDIVDVSSFFINSFSID